MSDFESMQQYERLKAALSTSPDVIAPRRRRRFAELFRHQLHRSVPVEPLAVSTPPPEVAATDQTVDTPEKATERPTVYRFDDVVWPPANLDNETN